MDQSSLVCRGISIASPQFAGNIGNAGYSVVFILFFLWEYAALGKRQTGTIPNKPDCMPARSGDGLVGKRSGIAVPLRSSSRHSSLCPDHGVMSGAEPAIQPRGGAPYRWPASHELQDDCGGAPQISRMFGHGLIPE